MIRSSRCIAADIQEVASIRYSPLTELVHQDDLNGIVILDGIGDLFQCIFSGFCIGKK